MRITFFPSRGDAPMSLSRLGGSLVIDGQEIALDSYVAGAHERIIGQPELVDGEWHVDLVLPHGANAGDAALFPERLTLDGDGPVALPPFDADEAVFSI
ncbi:hypothetical protein [Roseovarius aquimarinus]|uniref:Uncharacterized protein n=1 Tax=Roseovarius aquimarinus TaxID=1229156 RepID=A0ABW7IAA0_9RHOB